MPAASCPPNLIASKPKSKSRSSWPPPKRGRFSDVGHSRFFILPSNHIKILLRNRNGPVIWIKQLKKLVPSPGPNLERREVHRRSCRANCLSLELRSELHQDAKTRNCSCLNVQCGSLENEDQRCIRIEGSPDNFTLLKRFVINVLRLCASKESTRKKRKLAALGE